MQVSSPLQKGKFRRRFKKERELWFWSSLSIVWWVFFFLIPLYGIVYAFFDYVPGRELTWDRFVGLKNFASFFQGKDAWTIIRNTLVIGGLNITVGCAAPIALALLFDELKGTKLKRVTQTVSYLPYFVSWVVVASILTTCLSSEGVVNQVLVSAGILEKPVLFLSEGKFFWGIITIANIWKNIGWNTILYMSAIAGIDQELYEAGAVDGLGRWGMVKHITLPSILPTIVLLFILGIGGILNIGYEQNLLIGQPTTREYWDIIDTYVYRYGIQMGRHSFAIAVGLMKSIIGLILVFTTNFIAKKTMDMSIF